MELSEAFCVLGTATPGDFASKFDRYIPRLHADGSVALAADDGIARAAGRTRELVHWVSTLEDDGDLTGLLLNYGKRDIQSLEKDLNVYLTDARIVFIANGEVRSGRTVGHVRYPWVSAVSWRPDLGVGRRPTVTLHMDQDFPVKALGSWMHYVEMRFPKGFHPGSLALDIARRVSAHNLAHGAPQRAHEALRAMADAPRRVDPPKGQEDMIVIPAHVECPLGAEYIGDCPDRAEWRVLLEDDAHDLSETPQDASALTPAPAAHTALAGPHITTTGGPIVAGADAADVVGQRRIGTAHLLLGLLADEANPVTRLLNEAGVDFRRVAERLETNAP
ncbi:Clp protease N-terminal domain-containing protein [Gordonia sp. NPDC062954]|uniref:Clp protease N-terminal domain-containing protein n=1 Tax=Gordonia sp. NPDC062954 TaxID=3364003 RepID=UPI0037CC4BA6